MDESIDAEQLMSILSQSKWVIIVTAILFIAFMIIFGRALKKDSIKRKESLHKEINSYMEIGQPKSYIYSGAISVSYDSVTYTRGNRSVIFDIPIDKETVLAPFMVDDWFKNRNYNGREADIIINDIKQYLIENKICKSVKIISDDEYNQLFEDYDETDDE